MSGDTLYGIEEVRRIVSEGETATVEFKGDRSPLPDNELVEAVVCLANHRGGLILIGVEDDGRVTGLHPNHKSSPSAIAALIAARTVPSLAAGVSFVE